MPTLPRGSHKRLKPIRDDEYWNIYFEGINNMQTPPRSTNSKSRGRSRSGSARRTVKVRKRLFKLKKKKTGPGASFTQGSIGKPFSKSLGKVTLAKAARSGAISKYETGGTISDPNCVYIGHSTCFVDEIVKQFARCVIKELMQQQGKGFAMWQETYPLLTNDYLHFDYYQDASTTTIITPGATLITPGDSFFNIANALVSVIQTAFSQPDAHVLRRIWWTTVSATGNRVAQVNCKDFKMDYNIASTLTLQNITLAGSVADPDDNRNAISNNPVQGYQYSAKGNTFIPRARLSGDVSYLPFRPAYNKGSFTNTAAASIPEVLVEPPTGSFFKRCTRSGKVKILPGEMKKSMIYTSKKMSVENLFYVFKEYLAAPATYDVKFGETRMFGLEKMLNSRTSENSVNVAWELDQTITCAYKYKEKTYTAPLVTNA